MNPGLCRGHTSQTCLWNGKKLNKNEAFTRFLIYSRSNMSNIYFTFLWSVCYLWCVCWKYGSFRFPGLQCCNRWPWWCRNWTRFFTAAPGILYSKWFFCIFGDLVLSQSDRLVKTRFQRLHVLFRKCVGVVCCIFHHSVLSKFINCTPANEKNKVL